MLKKITTAALCFVLMACGGGGNGSGAAGLNHNELAENFVKQINTSGQLSVTLVRSSTDQKNFIVVYNGATDQYVAINIDGYAPNSDAYAYYQANRARFFYDLDVLPGHYVSEDRREYDLFCECYVYNNYDVWVPTKYRDRRADLVFEKINASPKDLEKMAAMKEAVTINQASEKLQTQFGLSAERSDEVARLTSAWQKAGGKDLTAREHDAFSKEVLGFSITDAQGVMKTGNEASINALIDKAASLNGTSPENVREILKQFQK